MSNRVPNWWALLLAQCCLLLIISIATVFLHLPLTPRREHYLHAALLRERRDTDALLTFGYPVPLADAHEDTLMRIKGIGPTTARRLVKHRASLLEKTARGIPTQEALTELRGIGEVSAIRLANRLSLSQVRNTQLDSTRLIPFCERERFCSPSAD